MKRFMIMAAVLLLTAMAWNVTIMRDITTGSRSSIPEMLPWI